MKRIFIKIFFCLTVLSIIIGCAATPKHESTGQYIDDSVITSKVKAAIYGDPSLKINQISVETYSGVVQLTGFVDKEEDIQRAGDIAKRVDGVKEVKNDLAVKK